MYCLAHGAQLKLLYCQFEHWIVMRFPQRPMSDYSNGNWLQWATETTIDLRKSVICSILSKKETKQNMCIYIYIKIIGLHNTNSNGQIVGYFAVDRWQSVCVCIMMQIVITMSLLLDWKCEICQFSVRCWSFNHCQLPTKLHVFLNEENFCN